MSPSSLLRHNITTTAVGPYSPRVGLVVKADIRPGHTDQIKAKVARVQERLAQSE